VSAGIFSIPRGIFLRPLTLELSHGPHSVALRLLDQICGEPNATANKVRIENIVGYIESIQKRP
jgi:hypothetical protein